MSEPTFVIDSIQLNRECLNVRPYVQQDECKATVTFHEAGQKKEYHNDYQRKGDSFIQVKNPPSPDLNHPRVLPYIKYAMNFDLHVQENERRYYFAISGIPPEESVVEFCAAVREFINFGKLASADSLKVKQSKDLERKIAAYPVAYLDAVIHTLDSFKKNSSEGSSERLSWVKEKIEAVAPQKRASEKLQEEKAQAEWIKKDCEPDGFGVASLGLHLGGGLVGSYFGPRPTNPEEQEKPDHSGIYGEIGAFSRLLPLPFSNPCYNSGNLFTGSNSALMAGATFFHQELGDHSIQGVRPFIRGQALVFHLGGGPIYGERTKTGQAIQGYNVHGGFSLPLLLGGGDRFGLIPDLMTFGYDHYTDPMNGESGGHEYFSAFNFGVFAALSVGLIIYWLSEGDMGG
jgi:hypothetical protein